MSNQETAKRYETIASHFVVCSLAELHGLTESDTRTGLRLTSDNQSMKGIELAKIWVEEYNSLAHIMDNSERHLNATRATAARLLLDDQVAEAHSSPWYSTRLTTSQQVPEREEQSDAKEVSFLSTLLRASESDSRFCPARLAA